MMTVAFEPILLRTFLAVVETAGFTAAARKLHLSQSTVSQHIQRLELAAGRPLLARDTHTADLTVDGNVMIDLAREILESMQRASDYFSNAAPRGRVRLGVSEMSRSRVCRTCSNRSLSAIRPCGWARAQKARTRRRLHD